MKLKLLAGAALAGALAAGSASATPADSGWYGAIDLGGHFKSPMVSTAQFGELGDSPANLRFNDAANFAGFARVGYKINPHFRVELEAGYRTTELTRLNER
jgi:OOP family OmpA-OmpF porin